MSARWSIPALLAVALVLAAAACGGGDEILPDEQGATAPLPPTPEERAPAGEYATEEFRPSFALELPAGWDPFEEPELVQFFSGETSQRVLSLSAELADTSVADAVGQMRGGENVEADEPTATTVAGHDGQVFTTRVASGYSADLPGVAYSLIEGFQQRVWVIAVQQSTLVIIADAPDEEADAFVAEVEQVLGTLEFGRSG